jgi:hypothetical protein
LGLCGQISATEKAKGEPEKKWDRVSQVKKNKRRERPSKEKLR